MKAITLILCVALTTALSGELVCAAAAEPDRPMTVSARRWWNLPSSSLPPDNTVRGAASRSVFPLDDPRVTYVLWFFEAKPHEELFAAAEALDALHRRPQVTVVGLTTDRSERVERLMERCHPAFPIGARSSAYRDFRIRRFPAIIVLLPAVNGARPPPERFAGSADGLADVAALLRAETGEWRDDPETRGLLDKARNHEHHIYRLEALRRLRMRMPRAAFMALCDELAAIDPPDPQRDSDAMIRASWQGEIAYLRHLADPTVTQKQPYLTPAIRVMAMGSPHDALGAPFLPVTSPKAAVEGKSVTELHALYVSHLGEDYYDLSMRDHILERLRLLRETDREAVRAVVLKLLPVEPDAGFRALIVGKISVVCQPGDEDAIRVLAAQLSRESDIRQGIPYTREVLAYLRTGRR